MTAAPRERPPLMSLLGTEPQRSFAQGEATRTACREQSPLVLMAREVRRGGLGPQLAPQLAPQLVPQLAPQLVPPSLEPPLAPPQLAPILSSPLLAPQLAPPLAQREAARGRRPSMHRMRLSGGQGRGHMEDQSAARRHGPRGFHSGFHSWPYGSKWPERAQLWKSLWKPLWKARP